MRLSAWLPLFVLVAACGLNTAEPACTFPPSRLNDNYCDCPETNQDEPMTSACSPVGVFRCKDRPDRVSFPSSRVNDGVCDCCDGSDEPAGVCSNFCAELDRKEREAREAEEKVRKEGEAGFAALLAKSKQLLCDGLSKNTQEEQQQPKVSEEELQSALKKVKELERKEEDANIAGKISSLQLDLLTKKDLQRIVVKLASQTSSGITLERLVAESPSCGSSKHSTSDEDYVATEGDEEPEASTEEEEDSKPPEDEDSEATESHEEPVSDCDPVWTDSTESGELVEARAELSKLEERAGKKATSDEIESNDDIIDDSKVDFGPGKVWRALKNECFTLQKDQYTYELCVFGQFKQDHTRLGKFERWSAAPYKEMLYGSGDMCFSPAVARSVRVKVRCAATTQLVDVFEPSTCVYEAIFETPAACVPDGFTSSETDFTCSAAGES